MAALRFVAATEVSSWQDAYPTVSSRHKFFAGVNQFAKPDIMCQIITNFVGPIAGGLVSGSIGIWMFWRKRLRDGKDAFLLVTADLRGKLAGTRQNMLEEFFQESIPVMGQAVYRVFQFLKKEQREALNKVWSEYKSTDKKIFGTGEEMLTAVIESKLEGNTKKPRDRLEEFFERFDECVKP